MTTPTFIKLKGQNLVYAVTFACSIGFLLFGYDLGFMGGLTTSTTFLKTFDDPNASLLGFLVSSYEIGALLGAVFVFLLGDRFGRRPIMVTGAVVVSTAQFIVGRIVAGFGLGMMTSVIPIWLIECATPKSRGRMMAMQLSNLIMGLIIAYWLDYGMAFYTTSVQWRFPCAFQIVLLVSKRQMGNKRHALNHYRFISTVHLHNLSATCVIYTMALKPRQYQFLTCLFVAIGSFMYGYDLTIVASVTSAQSFSEKFRPSATELGLFASLLTGGGFVGSAIAYPTSDFFGRRVTILTGGLIFCLGAALQTGAIDYSYQLGGRVVSGVGIGILLMIVPLYQAELAHPDIRGLVTGLQQIMLGVGGVIGSWLSYGTFVGFKDNCQWQIPLGVQIFPAFTVATMIFMFPGSPRWLFQQGKDEKGLAVLAKLHAVGNVEDAFVQAEAVQIRAEMEDERVRGARSFKELFSTKFNSRRVILACAMQAATQMAGISAIQYFSPRIFEQIGISNRDTLKYQAINSVLGLIAEFLLMLIVDKVGRRRIIIGGSLAMSATYVVSTALLAGFPASSNNTGAHWGFIVMTWMFNFFFAPTGSLSWIVPAELFDTATRTKGVALGCMVSFAFNTMIGQVTPIALEKIHWQFYILFVVTNISNAAFFWAFLPETKRVPLEEMKVLFQDSPLFVGWRDTSVHLTNETNNLERTLDDKGKTTVVEHHEG